jgi:hypothetical protein
MRKDENNPLSPRGGGDEEAFDLDQMVPTPFLYHFIHLLSTDAASVDHVLISLFLAEIGFGRHARSALSCCKRNLHIRSQLLETTGSAGRGTFLFTSFILLFLHCVPGMLLVKNVFSYVL